MNKHESSNIFYENIEKLYTTVKIFLKLIVVRPTSSVND